MSSLGELDHLRIPFDAIKCATNNFAEQNSIGLGGFGRVYKGQLPSSTSSSEPDISIAVKRLDVRRGQGQREFLSEIVMLASYKHDNLVSLVGFSDEGDESLLVYKHEVNGSLDKHLASTSLTWEQRLRICLGAARGLDYLHSGVGKGHRVLHRDLKSSNILLNADWNAKISDFGLSKIGPTNQQFTLVATNACGTVGYVDPVYYSTGIFTKDSDVYSFGVILFEVLCGRLAVGTYEDERIFLPPLVRLHQQKGTLHNIILPSLLQQAKSYSLQDFSNIAFQCLNEDRTQRPPMVLVVKGLETALNHQLDPSIPFTQPDIGARTDLWGSLAGGDPFVFRLESNQRLKKITIYHARWIHALIFIAEDSDGLLYSSQQYGGLSDPYTRGKKLDQIDFDADEEIIGLSGTYGIHNDLMLISSLSFKTNKKTHGPFGMEAKNSFSGSWDLGLFDGFYGQYGWYIDAIGCCLKTISKSC